MSDIAKLVCQTAGKDLPIQMLADGMAMEYTGSPERLQSELAFPITTLENAVDLLYHFYEENPSICDVEVLKTTR